MYALMIGLLVLLLGALVFYRSTTRQKTAGSNQAEAEERRIYGAKLSREERLRIYGWVD